MKVLRFSYISLSFRGTTHTHISLIDAIGRGLLLPSHASLYQPNYQRNDNKERATLNRARDNKVYQKKVRMRAIIQKQGEKEKKEGGRREG